jgi:hypothetical protein
MMPRVLRAPDKDRYRASTVDWLRIVRQGHGSDRFLGIGCLITEIPMLIILALSLCLSALFLTVSLLVPSEGRTNWPMMILAHLFWPVTLAIIIRLANRARRGDVIPA